MAAVQKEELADFAKEVTGRIQPKNDSAFVIFLSGNLGAGKTSFMQALAHALGVADTVQSPTFVLMKKYPIEWNGFSALVHIDAYRLEDPHESAALRPETFLGNPKNIVAIEWPENIASILPQPDLILKFSSEGMEEGEREISIEVK